MANKNFHLKVIVPTADGLTTYGQFDAAPYYLCFNLSDLSYQLAEKLRQREFSPEIVSELMLDAKIRGLTSTSTMLNELLSIEIPEDTAIEEALHRIIDNLTSVTYFLRQQPSGVLVLEK